MRKVVSMIAIAGVLACSCSNKKEEQKNMDNPFLQVWDTPYEVPPFDKIKNEHYIPAFEEAIKQQKQEIDDIINNKETPNFQNTIEALEYSGKLLDKVSSVFFNLTSCMNSKEMEAIADSISPVLTQHGDDISLNAELFKRIKTVYENKDKEDLNKEQLRLLEDTYKSFVRGGANVPVEKQARFREINEKLSVLTLKFGNNVLGATNNYKLIVDDPAKLNGLTQDQIAAAAQVGNADETTKGKWVFTIQLPSMEPFLQNSKDRELRKELWTAYSTRCTSGEFNNKDVIDEIANLRMEKANILGFASHADFVLDDAMAKTPKAVNNLLTAIWTPALVKAKQEAAQYQKMINAEGGKFKLEPSDWRYYAEKLRKEKYDLNDEMIRPYLSLDAVKNGIFMICEKLYGISFVQNATIPVYTQGVEAFEVKEGNEIIAILYMDYHPRESKRSGAWMSSFREQYINQNGKNVIPIVTLVMNFTAPTTDKPSLLNFDETGTFFHEFGHGLHGMLSKCHYKSLSGTSVSRDFVELPSQIFEHWASYPEVMRMYAKHYQTGEIIPDELIQKIEAASTYGQGFINTELLAASFLDMNYYTITEPTKITLPNYEDNAMKQIGLIPEIISRYKSTYFQHIFSGGYSSGYYGYTWSAVLDNDAFEAFKEKGVFNKEVANSFRKNILEKGNTEDAMTLYVKFRGHEPSIEPLLKNRGLK